MSSLSLPRVLQQRKTSLEQERETFEKCQGVSISKAINQVETPVKEKHVRSAILGTFHEKGGETFWTIALRLPLQENRIAAWKFCHVLHKLLREGHPQTVPDSYQRISYVEDLGRLWGHLRDCYGKLIQQYCNLLKVKLDFHHRNPRIPGNLILSHEELDAIGENDANNYFQLSVEMFDYMDEILALQTRIFGSLDMSRSNSMTPCGQCRLAPLIPMIQDSSQLYDTCVKLLFKLHAALPPDLLSGHRTRFLNQFRTLREFYMAASILQYFRNLIQIPTLPENPPNFLIQAELRSYVTPVVILPTEEPPDFLEAPSETGELVDLGDTVSMVVSNGNKSPDVLVERDNLIEHLQNELSRVRMELAKLNSEHYSTMRTFNEKINNLETELAKKSSELLHERQQKEDLLQQTQLIANYQETELKAKKTEEKFQKMMEVYTKLRNEHIELLRKKADVDKQLSTIKAAELDLNEKSRLEELAQELANLQAASDSANEEKQALESKLDFLQKEKGHIESELHDLLSQKQELDVMLKKSHEKLDESTALLKALKDKIYAESRSMVDHAIHEADNPAFFSATCSIDYFLSLVGSLEQAIINFEEQVTTEKVVKLAHLTSQFVILGKATSNTSPDIEFGERMGNRCKTVGEYYLTVLKDAKEGSPADLSGMRTQIKELLEMTSSLRVALQSISSESIGDVIESELAAMVTAIEEATTKIEEMLSQSRSADTGIKLEVNEKILDSCTGLMQAIRILVQKSRILQAEIVSQGKDPASVKEFYKRNHQWTEGLISAAKAVGMGANYLLEAADEVVKGKGKIESVVAAAQGISASTAQLVAASRVKADRGSKSLVELTGASKSVTQAAATVLTTAKTCVQLVEQSEDLDMSGLSLHNAKRLEMEVLVKVLELENCLTKERFKLAALRKHHYSLEANQQPPS